MPPWQWLIWAAIGIHAGGHEEGTLAITESERMSPVLRRKPGADRLIGADENRVCAVDRCAQIVRSDTD